MAARTETARRTSGRTRGAWFWDRPIALQVASAVALLSAVFVVVGGGGAVALWHAGVNLEQMSASTTVQNELAALSSGQLRSHTYAVQVAAADSSSRDVLLRAWKANDAAVDDQITAFSGEQGDTWQQFVAGWKAWETVRDTTVLPAAEHGDLMALAQGLAVPAADPQVAGTPLSTLQSHSDARVASVMSNGQREIRTVIAILMVAFLVGATASGLLTVTVTRRITRALHGVEVTLTAMADGDLTTPVVVTTKDEAGRMAAALGRMQESLRTTLSEVIAAAGRVTDAVGGLTAANGRAAGSTRETSSQADVLAGSAEQVSRNVQAVAAGASQIHQSISEIASNASSAASVAERATAAARTANERVARLGDSSRQIGSVVKVITQVAEQTNLLALNATIEAARAGEAGKGFAVVAGEVKALAQETAQATGDIARQVEAIQLDTGGAVEAIEEIGSIIEAINDYQTTIAAAVEEQAATTTEMSRGVDEAAAGTEQIAGSIGGVARSAGSSAVVVDEVQQQIGMLTQAADEIRRSVSGYQTGR
ncbi:methyl-accepting chemotaxis protein [Cellulomonas citrea]|uniref:methyl-accepting chemotaxis protein n=1 Tax=Cellulomonas citrea TaxID=1909423 RepID=UPI00135C2629|nr:methyl-accepting chemotaxis protein [Cellulomonas citrea]